jgi:hypothetical protein
VNSIIGALRFVFGADTAQLEKATADASRSLRGAAAAGEAAGRAISNAFIGVGSIIAAALSVDALARFTTESIKAGAEVGRFAEQAGLTAQQFQRLQGAVSGAGQSSQEFAAGIGAFARNFSDLQRGTGPFLDFLERFAPALVNQFKAAKDTQEAFNLFADVLARMTNAQDRARIAAAAGGEQFAKLADEMRRGSTAIQLAGNQYKTLSDAEIAAARDLERRWNQLWHNFQTTAQSAIIAVVSSLGLLQQATSRSVEAITRDMIAAQRAMGGTAENTEAARQALERFRSELIETQTRQLMAQPIETPTIDLEKEDQKKKAQEAEKLRLQGLRDATREWRDESRAALDTVIQAPTETFANKMAAIKQALDNGTISMRQFGEMTRRVQKENQGHMLDLASTTATALTSIFGKNKAAGIAAAIINTAVGITKALATLPPPFSFAQAALVAAMGAAQIATIRSTNEKGGGGGAPSVSSSGGSGAELAAGPAQTLMVQGIDPNGLFSGEAVRNLAEKLVAFQKDGGVVVIK